MKGKNSILGLSDWLISFGILILLSRYVASQLWFTDRLYSSSLYRSRDYKKNFHAHEFFPAHNKKYITLNIYAQDK